MMNAYDQLEVEQYERNRAAQELETLCKSHDWFYDFSDDSGVYNRGFNERQKITSLVEELGELGKEIYQTYRLR
jgi:hypothetical protein